MSKALIESILSCVMDKIDHSKNYDPESLVISYTELEETLNSMNSLKEADNVDMREHRLQTKGLSRIEEICMDLDPLEDKEGFPEIYKIAHTLNAKNCRKNHPKWTEEIEALYQEEINDKSLEERAKAHADSRCPEQGDEFIVWCMCRDDFIAGALSERKESKEATVGALDQRSFKIAEQSALIENLQLKNKYLSEQISLESKEAVEDKWIPVSERLPELDQMVLTYGFDKIMAWGKMTHHKWWEAVRDGCEHVEITHWMPLPAPPINTAKESGEKV